MIFVKTFQYNHTGIASGSSPVPEIVAILVKDPMARTQQWMQAMYRGSVWASDHPYHIGISGCLREEMTFRWPR